MMPKGRNADRTPILHGEDVIMDGWCKENLAILREDGEFARLDANGKGSHLKHDDPLNHITGPEALKTVEKYKAEIDNSPHFQDVFNTEFQRLVDEKHEWPKSALCAATSVFHPEFGGQANAALHKEVKQVRDAKDVREAARHAGGTKKSPMKKLFRNRAKEAKQKQVSDQAAQVKQASLAGIQAIGVARSLGSNIRGAKAEAPGIIASAKELFLGPWPDRYYGSSARAEVSVGHPSSPVVTISQKTSPSPVPGAGPHGTFTTASGTSEKTNRPRRRIYV